MSIQGEQALRVVSLESRHAAEMARLLERHGCEVLRAPSMREVPLADQHEALAFGDELLAGRCDVCVLLTGVGTRMLVDCLSTRRPRAEVIGALGRCQLVCRGPKPVAALKALGLRPSVVAPEPNTWQDLVAVLDEQLPVRGLAVAVQEYGRSQPALLEALAARGARVRKVAIYAWALPEDTAPLTAAVRRLCEGQADVVLFTSGQQVEHLLSVARQHGLEAALRDALAHGVVCASIGPITTEALRAAGLEADLVPEHPKMGHLVSEVAARGRKVLADKHAAAAG